MFKSFVFCTILAVAVALPAPEPKPQPKPEPKPGLVAAAYSAPLLGSAPLAYSAYSAPLINSAPLTYSAPLAYSPYYASGYSPYSSYYYL